MSTTVGNDDADSVGLFQPVVDGRRAFHVRVYSHRKQCWNTYWEPVVGGMI